MTTVTNFDWQPLELFWAPTGAVVLRRWEKRGGGYQYSLISAWKSVDDYFPGSEFLLIEE